MVCDSVGGWVMMLAGCVFGLCVWVVCGCFKLRFAWFSGFSGWAALLWVGACWLGVV